MLRRAFPRPGAPRGRSKAKLSLVAAMDSYQPDEAADVVDQGAAPSQDDEGKLQQGDSGMRADSVGGEAGESGGDAPESQLLVASRPNNGLVAIAVDLRHVAQKRSA
ncbi:unnamed protein product [Vitrella brassicaformis CCMP3155]|uniref:Uncharacterized protein n=1 Tax=Vitrella brassicaformis (strain CCMP3155) TaxID=1169540 RepID=A0A0G4GF47_VITBC|nr:unnamed protein product [Vitrella brassicaformis CCMP3155]|eukprot:CEM28140.1 unnamed protein product [Vitrella brassicaformis CCMP3155]